MSEKPANEYLDGKILLIDKPLKWTSFDVVNKVRYAIKRGTSLKKVKVGHAGTLDPLASGLLILCTGKKTKNIDEIQQLPKTYSGIFKIGGRTKSFDLETEVTDHKAVDHINEEMIRELEKDFTGELEQIPPIFSAVKHEGRRAYELARDGQNPKLSKRKVTVYSINLERLSTDELSFKIVCSKGTYIRSIARDIGEALQCGAYISVLRRERIGDYSVDDSLSVEEMVERINKSAPANDEITDK